MSIEKATKQQFARVFTRDDWPHFKTAADAILHEATTVTARSFRRFGRTAPSKPELLRRRNARIRLLLGVGVELLLKAWWLKRGETINKSLPAGLDPSNTLQLNDLIAKLEEAVKENRVGVDDQVLDGLKIAKVLRNKEAHIVTDGHRFVEAEYELIERAVVAVYATGFGETLSFSIGLKRKAPRIFAIG